MDLMDIPWWIPTAIGIVSITVGYYAHAILARLQMTGAQRRASDILKDARLQAEITVKEGQVQAQEELLRLQRDFKEETRAQREEMKAVEERLTRRESNLDRQVAMLEKKDEKLEHELAEVHEKLQALAAREEELHKLTNQESDTLQKMAAMSQDEARKTLMARMEEEMRGEAAQLLRHIREQTKEEAEREAREVITTAIQRYASAQASEVTTCTVNLPSDEMKGRIIGREGRNIRSLEAVTGVDILIDDTPEVVVISGFDPLRREVARISIERLIADGRIHPARIEEVVTKVQEEIEDTIRAAGEAAIYELGLQGVAPELVRAIGSLKFRHSFSQNVLQHSIEVAHLMGMMASDLGLDPHIAKRVGLFHDIGKAIDHQVEGGHALIGADLLRKHGEQPLVINAVAAHHGDVETESLYASLASAADAITASRPGARSETTDIYLKRLKNLEEIANGFRGVEKAYAIQAGRELRVIVEPSKIDDNEALQMARNISKQIQEQLQYPGQIRVTVIRETRCVEFAR